MKRIPEPNPFSDEKRTPEQELLVVARSADNALDIASSEMDAAMMCLHNDKLPAAYAHFGAALQAIRDGKERAGWLQRSLHDAYGVETEE